MANAPLKNKDYDLVSVLYHASQGVETCGRYASDAEQDGDKDAEAFFTEVGDQYASLVDKGKALLKQRL